MPAETTPFEIKDYLLTPADVIFYLAVSIYDPRAFEDVKGSEGARLLIEALTKENSN